MEQQIGPDDDLNLTLPLELYGFSQSYLCVGAIDKHETVQVYDWNDGRIHD